MEKKKLTRYKEKFLMVEMSNLGPEDTGLDRGFIRVSTQEGNHGPRVKYYRKPGKDQPYAGIEISVNPKIFYDDLKMTRKEREQAIEFVRLNHKKLGLFWKKGTNWSRKETNEFFDSLVKIDVKTPQSSKINFLKDS